MASVAQKVTSYQIVHKSYVKIWHSLDFGNLGFLRSDGCDAEQCFISKHNDRVLSFKFGIDLAEQRRLV